MYHYPILEGDSVSDLGRGAGMGLGLILGIAFAVLVVVGIASLLLCGGCAALVGGGAAAINEGIEERLAESKSRSAEIEANAEQGIFTGQAAVSESLGLSEASPMKIIIVASLEFPSKWDVKGVSGNLSIRNKDGADLWSGPVSQTEEISSRGQFAVTAILDYDDSNPQHRDLRAQPELFSTLTAQFNADHVMFADGTETRFENRQSPKSATP